MAELEGMVVVNARKLEVLKVFYGIFIALMDGNDLTDAEVLAKLRLLRARLRGVVGDAEMN